MSVVLIQPTEPTTRFDGSPLQANDVWVGPAGGDSTTNYIYNGASFVSSSLVVIDRLGAPVLRPSSQGGGSVLTGDLWINKYNQPYEYNGLGWQPVFSQIILQAVEPTTRPDGSALQTGDFWADSSDNNTTYEYSGSSFVVSAGPNVLIYQFPAPTTRPSGSPLESGDIWVNSAGEVYEYTGGGWIDSSVDVITSTTEPTVNNEGAALAVGDIWQSTSTGEVSEWDGAAWQPSSIAVEVDGVFAPLAPGTETVTGQPLSFIISNIIGIKEVITTYGNDGVYTPVPGGGNGGEELRQQPAVTPACYVTGFIIEPGGLLATEANGAVPADTIGGIITVGAVLVNPDIFAPSES